MTGTRHGKWSAEPLEPIETQGREMKRHRSSPSFNLLRVPSGVSLARFAAFVRFAAAPTAVLATLALAMAPASAMAGSLLSGYGGPGSGTQALLGSTLVGGAGTPGGGSSVGGGSGDGSATAPGGATGIGAGGGTGSGGQAGGGGQSRGGLRAGGRGSGAGGSRAGGGSRGATGTSGASAGGSAAYTLSGSLRVTAGLAAADDTGLLGLSGGDVLLFALMLGVLALTAGMTRRLAGPQH